MVSAPQHPTDRDLVASKRGTLDGSKAAEVNKHLRSCITCQHRLRSLPIELDGSHLAEPRQSHENGTAAFLAAVNADRQQPRHGPGSRAFGVHRSLRRVAGGIAALATIGLLTVLAAWAAGAFRTTPLTSAAKSGQPVVGAGESIAPIPQDKESSKQPSTVMKSAKSASAVAENSSARQQRASKERTSETKQADQAKSHAADFFNGHDLSGWQGVHAPWRVDKGAIIGASAPGQDEPGLLCSRKKYRDFDLRFQVSLDDENGECAVQFRSYGLDAAHVDVAGPRCAIYGKNPPKDHSTGSLVTEPLGKAEKAGPAKLVERFVKPNGNHFHIRCQGKHVLIEVNGIKTVNADFPAIADDGVIAWRLEAKRPPQKVSFKIIRFEELTGRTLPPTPQSPALADSKLLAAEVKFEAAMKIADQNLLNQFDSELDHLKGSKRNMDEKLLAAVEHERQVFKEQGLIPWSRPMRKWLLRYGKELAAARRKAGIALDAAIDRARKTRNEKQREALDEEASRILAPRRVAIWQHVDGEQTHRMVFWSDGTFVYDDHEDETPSHFWAPPLDDKIAIEFGAENDPTATLALVFELAPDGTTMIGLTKSGQEVRWQRVEE
jgi:hypothetical protein